MSAESESFAFDENVDAEYDIHPGGVDWDAIADEYAGSNGMLDASTRTDALTQSVDGIDNSRQANALLADAAEMGIIDERAGDYYLTESETDLTVDDVDWHDLFASVASGVENPLPQEAQRKVLIQHYLGLASEADAEALVSEAYDRGILTTPNDSQSGLFLSDVLEADHEPEPAEPSSVQDDTRSELEALRAESDDVEDYVGNLEGLLTDVLDRLEAVETRQDQQDERFNEYVKAKNEEQRVGLTELQIRRLREGDMLSTDGVDMDVLRDEFGDDLVTVSGGDAVRLAEPKTDEDTSRSTELPDFDTYCELEAERLKLHLKLRTPADVKGDGVDKYRCLTVWSNAETLATSNNADKMLITKAQIKSWILKHARNGAKESSMDTVCNRVMDAMESYTDGVVEKKVRNGNSVLFFDADELAEARCPRFQSRSLDGDDGGDLITPLL